MYAECLVNHSSMLLLAPFHHGGQLCLSVFRLLRPDCTGLCDAHWARSLHLGNFRALCRSEMSSAVPWKTPAFARFLHWHQGADWLRPMLVISKGLWWMCKIWEDGGNRQGKGRRYFWLFSAHVGSHFCLYKACLTSRPTTSGRGF